MQTPTVPVTPSAPTSATALAALGTARLAAAAVQLREGAVTLALASLDRIATEPGLREVLAPADDARLTALLLDCRLARGDMGEAMRLGDDLAPHLDQCDDHPASATAHHACGDLAAALGDPALASGHYLACGGALAGLPEQPSLLPWRASKALVLVRSSRAREAGVLAAEHHEVALADGSPYAVATSLRVLAATLAGSERVGLLREAREVLRDVRADRLAAQVDADLAGLLMLTPDPATDREAVTLLRRSEAYAGRQELWPLQGRVRRMLDRLGEAPQRVSSEALAMLTVTERRVAGLAAGGLSNRQIAEKLRVSVKAVEWHLSRTYRKLGISSRLGLTPIFGTPA